MSLRIIDNKRVDLTDAEWLLYQDICKSYSRLNFNGSDLFKGLFETDQNGIIIFLRPPTTRTSMEVFMFLVNIMIHQHLGLAMGHTDRLCERLENKIAEADTLIERLTKILNKAEKRRAK